MTLSHRLESINSDNPLSQFYNLDDHEESIIKIQELLDSAMIQWRNRDSKRL
jgi:hypothetical protein